MLYFSPFLKNTAMFSMKILSVSEMSFLFSKYAKNSSQSLKPIYFQSNERELLLIFFSTSIFPKNRLKVCTLNCVASESSSKLFKELRGLEKVCLIEVFRNSISFILLVFIYFLIEKSEKKFPRSNLQIYSKKTLKVLNFYKFTFNANSLSCSL